MAGNGTILNGSYTRLVPQPRNRGEVVGLCNCGGARVKILEMPALLRSGIPLGTPVGLAALQQGC